MKFNSLLAGISMISVSLSVSAANPSGTLPIFYISTENGAQITSKEDYINATYYLTVPEGSDFDAVGTAEEPVATEIRGRGNYTWIGFDKKPYKLKLAKKTALLGMPKSKHWTLLAHADDDAAYLRNTVGFELSRRLGLEWTPNQQPVEVVLNGDYIGLYMLTENIRVEETRVNIFEQADNETVDVTGGWLVEIDNYDTDPHITIKEHNTPDAYANIFFTYKTPEILSPEQEQFLTDQMNAINDAIYVTDKNSTEWERYIDIDALARYYIVQELMDDCESFHGSCYLYRDLGEDAKWKFGPVWDFGNAFRRNNGQKRAFIYENPQFHQVWIGEIAKFPRFQSKVRQIWAEFAAEGYKGLESFISDFADQISVAAQSDKERWPQYGQDNFTNRVNNFKSHISSSATWLGEEDRWNAEVSDPKPLEIYITGYHTNWGFDDAYKFTYDEVNDVYDLINVSIPARANNQDNQIKIATSDWTTVDLGYGSKTRAAGELTTGTPLQLTWNGGNIPVPADINNADFRLNLKTLTLENAPTGTLGDAGVEMIGASDICINGNMVSTPGLIRVFDAAGNLIKAGYDNVTLSGSGLFLIVSEGATRKVIL